MSKKFPHDHYDFVKKRFGSNPETFKRALRVLGQNFGAPGKQIFPKRANHHEFPLDDGDEWDGERLCIGKRLVR